MITEVIKITADTSDATPKIDKLDSSLDNLNSTNKGVAKGMKESTNSVLENGGAMGILNDLTGGLAMTIKDGVEAMVLFSKESKIATLGQSLYASVVGTSTGAMKLFRLALAGTGIGLLVLALVSLVLNFGKVTDAVTKFLPGLKMVGDFFKTVSNAVTDFVGITSEAERELEKFNEQAKKSLKQNEDYLQTRGDLLDKFSTKKVEAKNKYLKALEEENLSDAKRLELQKRLNRDLANIDKEREDDRLKIKKEAQDKIDAENKKIKDAKKVEQNKEKTEQDAQDKIDEEKRKEREQYQKDVNEGLAKMTIDSISAKAEESLLEEENQQKRFEGITAEVEALEASNAQKIESDRKAEQERKDLAQKTEDFKLGLASQTLNLLGGLAKRGSALAKGTAVAQAIISTYQGVNKALAETTDFTPSQTLRFINAGLVGAAGFANVAKILSTKESQSGGAPSLGSQGGGAPSAPSFNLVQGTGANQIASSLATQNKPIQAYVVSTNVTTAQSLDRNIIQNSKI